MLPPTTTDRILAAGTVVAAVLFVAVAALNWDALRGGDTAAAESAVAAHGSAAVRETVVTTVEPRRPAPVARPRPAKPRPAPSVLTIEAVGGDSWLEARRGDAGGEQLHYGILAAGEKATLRPLPVWVRVGAVRNLEIRVGGTPVARVPAAADGVAEFVASRRGIQPLAG